MGRMGSLADVTLGDIGRALARYRPVAITVAIILVVIAVLPGPRGAVLGSIGSVPPPAGAATTSDVVAGAEGAAPADTTVPVDAGSSSSSSSFDSSSSFSSSSSSSSSSDFSSDASSSDFSSGGSSSGSDFGVPAPTSTFAEDGSSSGVAAAPARPLTVVGSGWASATGATPLGATGVPAGSLPVGKRIGQVDKYSFVRLDGDEKVLRLPVIAEGARSTTGAIAISICQITDAGWEEKENVPSDAAPKYDTASCVPGDPGDGTAYSFNLVTFTSPSDARGFALVPTGDSIDYQVNFKP